MQVNLTTCSGHSLEVSHIRLVNAEQLIRALEIVEKMRVLAGGSFGTAVPNYVSGIIAAIGVVWLLVSRSQEEEMKQLASEFAELTDRIHAGGTFVPVESIDGIEIPMPPRWRSQIEKRLRGEHGIFEKIINFMHSGDPYVTIRTTAGDELAVFWDSLESYSVAGGA